MGPLASFGLMHTLLPYLPVSGQSPCTDGVGCLYTPCPCLPHDKWEEVSDCLQHISHGPTRRCCFSPCFQNEHTTHGRFATVHLALVFPFVPGWPPFLQTHPIMGLMATTISTLLLISAEHQLGAALWVQSCSSTRLPAEAIRPVLVLSDHQACLIRVVSCSGTRFLARWWGWVVAAEAVQALRGADRLGEFGRVLCVLRRRRCLAETCQCERVRR